MLPQTKGKYTARACGALSFGPPTKNGHKQAAIPFEITQGEHTGETITWITVLHATPDKNGVDGEQRFIDSLLHMGWQGEDPTELMEVSDEQIRALLPDEVELSCDVETYEGKTRLKVQWVNKAGAGRFTFKESTSKGDLRSWAAQMKASVRSARGASGARPSNGSSKPKPSDTDDSPF
jgi:hypothetical protein